MKKTFSQWLAITKPLPPMDEITYRKAWTKKFLEDFDAMKKKLKI